MKCALEVAIISVKFYTVYRSEVFSKKILAQLIKGAFFGGYSGYSYSGLGITECTEFRFRKERSYMFQI